jgi:hypothetical protein
VHGYYIEIGRSHADRVPDDYQRRQTLKGAERYITPELKRFEDQVLSARERALAREKALYEQLLEALREDLAPLQTSAAAIATLDVLCNLAERAERRTGPARAARRAARSRSTTAATRWWSRSAPRQAASPSSPTACASTMSAGC